LLQIKNVSYGGVPYELTRVDEANELLERRKAADSHPCASGAMRLHMDGTPGIARWVDGTRFFPENLGVLLRIKIVSDGGVPSELTRFGEANELAMGATLRVNRLAPFGSLTAKARLGGRAFLYFLLTTSSIPSAP
jgi:hypothetical protein